MDFFDKSAMSDSNKPVLINRVGFFFEYGGGSLPLAPAPWPGLPRTPTPRGVPLRPPQAVKIGIFSLFSDLAVAATPFDSGIIYISQ